MVSECMGVVWRVGRYDEVSGWVWCGEWVGGCGRDVSAIDRLHIDIILSGHEDRKWSRRVFVV